MGTEPTTLWLILKSYNGISIFFFFRFCLCDEYYKLKSTFWVEQLAEFVTTLLILFCSTVFIWNFLCVWGKQWDDVRDEQSQTGAARLHGGDGVLALECGRDRCSLEQEAITFLYPLSQMLTRSGTKADKNANGAFRKNTAWRCQACDVACVYSWTATAFWKTTLGSYWE